VCFVDRKKRGPYRRGKTARQQQGKGKGGEKKGFFQRRKSDGPERNRNQPQRKRKRGAYKPPRTPIPSYVGKTGPPGPNQKKKKKENNFSSQERKKCHSPEFGKSRRRCTPRGEKKGESPHQSQWRRKTPHSPAKEKGGRKPNLSDGPQKKKPNPFPATDTGKGGESAKSLEERGAAGPCRRFPQLREGWGGKETIIVPYGRGKKQKKGIR